MARSMSPKGDTDKYMPLEEGEPVSPQVSLGCPLKLRVMTSEPGLL